VSPNACLLRVSCVFGVQSGIRLILCCVGCMALQFDAAPGGSDCSTPVTGAAVLRLGGAVLRRSLRWVLVLPVTIVFATVSGEGLGATNR
jgi:hypothetical protein